MRHALRMERIMRVRHRRRIAKTQSAVVTVPSPAATAAAPMMQPRRSVSTRVACRPPRRARTAVSAPLLWCGPCAISGVPPPSDPTRCTSG